MFWVLAASLRVLNKAKFDTPRRLAVQGAHGLLANLTKFALFAIFDMTKQRARDADIKSQRQSKFSPLK